MFDQLEENNSRPQPFEFYTTEELWNDDYTSKQMLQYHLNSEIDVSSRKTVFIERSTKWIISQFDLKEGRSVIDFGCGPGLYTERLAKTNAKITGIDFSMNSIKYARNKATNEILDIQYINMNYLEYNTEERYDLIIMIMCDFCALSPEQRKIMLNKFKNLLKPNGSILLDVYSLTAFNQKDEKSTYEINLSNHYWSPDKYYGFLNEFKYEADKVTLEKYTIIEKGCTRRIYNWLQYYNKERIKKEFAENDLIIEKYLANVAGDEFEEDGNEFAVIAKQ
jgi:2-polyprenyl-3-methyl-5-hydroxy-6-metoxy-1,4-benzoquinol methylase